MKIAKLDTVFLSLHSVEIVYTYIYNNTSWEYFNLHQTFNLFCLVACNEGGKYFWWPPRFVPIVVNQFPGIVFLCWQYADAFKWKFRKCNSKCLLHLQ